jgi:hypothetical protein
MTLHAHPVIATQPSPLYRVDSPTPLTLPQIATVEQELQAAEQRAYLFVGEIITASGCRSFFEHNWHATPQGAA